MLETICPESGIGYCCETASSCRTGLGRESPFFLRQSERNCARVLLRSPKDMFGLPRDSARSGHALRSKPTTVGAWPETVAARRFRHDRATGRSAQSGRQCRQSVLRLPSFGRQRPLSCAIMRLIQRSSFIILPNLAQNCMSFYDWHSTGRARTSTSRTRSDVRTLHVIRTFGCTICPILGGLSAPPALAAHSK